MTYEEAIREAMNHFGDAMVLTSGYDEEIDDHFNDLEEDSREVHIEQNATIYSEDERFAGWEIRWVDARHYIDTGEPVARIVSIEDYEKLAR